MTERVRILLVEDDRQISQFLLASISAAGYAPVLSRTVAEAIQAFADQKPALAILDLGLPDGEGADIILTIRSHSDIPILVLSARQSEQEKVNCLNLGADDYLSKPFGVDELLARVRVALRRSALMAMRDDVYRIGELAIDLANGIVSKGGEAVHLSPIEFKLLMLLAQRPGRVFTHRQLLAEVWGPEYVDDTHYLRIHMGRLRARLEDHPAEPRYLLTELGIGYRLAAQ